MTAELVMAEPGEAPMRRCVARRASVPAGAMIRFVVGPDRVLVPDLAGRLPGRGFWVSAERGVVDQAVQRRLFAKAAQGQVEVAPDLGDRLEGLLVQRCLDLLGLARRAGQLVAGFDQVHESLKAGRAGLVLVASDAAPDGRRKIEQAARGIEIVPVFDRVELGHAIGRDEIVHLAVAPGGIMTKLAAELGRLQGFRASASSQAMAAGLVAEREKGISRT